jgi:Ca-activated chloride channel family protein
MTDRLGVDAPRWLLLLVVLLPMAAIAGRTLWASRRDRLGALARLLLVLAVALAAAGVHLKLPAKRLGVVFVLDRSASLPEAAREGSVAFVREAAGAMGEGDRAAVVVVGDGAVVESEPRDRLDLVHVESQVSPHQTDLASGLRLAEAVMPSEYTRRVVVLSDGEETRGDAVAQAASAAEDVEIWSVPFARGDADEVLLEGISGPDRVAEGAAFELRVVARSKAPTKGVLHLYRNERHLGALDVQLTGRRADLFVLRQDADEPGFLRYRASLEVDPSADAVPQNNVAVTTVAVEGRARILYVEGKDGQSGHLAQTLRAEGMAVDVVGPGEMPASLAKLQPYAAVLLSDVPAYALTERQMEVLRRYVRDLGRGFAMLGGDESFGVGGYYATPVEEILPVRMDIQDKKYFPSLSMVLAIDKSGSMGGVGRAEKLGMAKEAAIQTMELMSERDRLGVISFDGAASWAVPMTPLTQKGKIRSAIASMRPGGGTDIYPALKESYGALHREASAQKHIILLSDGVTVGGDFQSLITLGTRRNITLTAIAIGDDSDRQSMIQWAQWGGGRHYLVTEPAAIPRIFTREAMLATRSFLIEEAFTPQLGAPAPVTRGLEGLRMPRLHGYVATEPKPRAEVALWAKRDENTPLLATWRHGLGRTAAWTSDCKARWARDWVGTEAYSRVFTQLARWLAATEEGGDVHAWAELERGLLTVTVDAFDEEGGFRNFLEGEARVVAPDLTVQSLPLQQVAPGRYEARAAATQDGSHLAAVILRDAGGNVVGQATAEAAQPYSPEYRPASGGGALLAEVSRVGRGRTLRPGDAASVFAPPQVPRRVPHPLWPPLVVLAALLLLADVAIRRLEWGRAPVFASVDVAALLPSRPSARPRVAKVARSAPSVEPVAMQEVEAQEDAPAPAEEPPSSAYVGGLLAARQRARDRRDP